MRKCCGVPQKWWMPELSTLCYCVQHPWKLTCRHFWSSRNKIKPLSKQKCVLRKCHGVYQKWWILEHSTLSNCVQHPWKLTCRDFLSPRNKRKSCSKYPWKLTCWDFWSSRNERKPLSKQKLVLRKCCGISQKQWMLELSTLCHCLQHPWKLTCSDSGSLGTEENNFLSKNVFWENAVDYLRNGEC